MVWARRHQCLRWRIWLYSFVSRNSLPPARVTAVGVVKNKKKMTNGASQSLTSPGGKEGKRAVKCVMIGGRQKVCYHVCPAPNAYLPDLTDSSWRSPEKENLETSGPMNICQLDLEHPYSIVFFARFGWARVGR